MKKLIIMKKLTEDDEDDGGPLEVKYVQGMKSIVKVKKFKSQAEYEKWYEKNKDEIEVLGFRDIK